MSVKDLIFGKKIASNRPKDKRNYADSIQEWLPISDIRDGVVITKDGRFVKILEVMPVNFYLKSANEQQNIVYYFASYLKIAPDNIQILTVTQKADTEKYIKRMCEIYDAEENENCRIMIEDNIAEIEYLADREALTRRFFIVIQYEQRMKIRGNNFEGIVQRLNDEANTARVYLDMCGLEVIQPEYSNEFIAETLYGLLNRKTSNITKISPNVFSMTGDIFAKEGFDF